MLTPLDEIANQNHLQLIKALIPHLPMDSQRPFSVLIKIMEIRNVLKYYSQTAGPGRKDYTEEVPDLLDILNDIRQYCEGDEAEMIDQALQMISMIELYSMFSQQEGESV